MSYENLPTSHPVNGLQDYIAISRYARFSPEKRRRETWTEAVRRVRDMHLGRYADRSLADAKLAALEHGDVTPAELRALEDFGGEGLHRAIRGAFDAVTRRAVLPSMRSLQFGGEAILTKHGAHL
jgi:ribonucleoside-diphosphate reductase alpha chain